MGIRFHPLYLVTYRNMSARMHVYILVSRHARLLHVEGRCRTSFRRHSVCTQQYSIDLVCRVTCYLLSAPLYQCLSCETSTIAPLIETCYPHVLPDSVSSYGVDASLTVLNLHTHVPRHLALRCHFNSPTQEQRPWHW